jgi:alpha-beta hydrolase superfamily lysophospholipase
LTHTKAVEMVVMLMARRAALGVRAGWANWADFFKQAGYAPLTPDWPDDPETVEEARANPDVLAKKTLKQVADHTAEIIGALDKKPVVMGHSTGGLLAEMLAGRGHGVRPKNAFASVQAPRCRARGMIPA